MPTATRRHALAPSQQPTAANTSDELPSIDADDVTAGALLDDGTEGVNEGGDDAECEEEQDNEGAVFPPHGLREISSLASWTVSSAKPGNGVAALRSPDTCQFWQSDGPQPHLLSIHFFKLVQIVHMRVFLDFEHDESYTPTKIQFFAGMGAHDLQEFSEMKLEEPTGWIEVDFSNVGPMEKNDDDSSMELRGETDWSKRPVLRAMLVQVKIMENHQNGKDTHLRSVQIFAQDETQQSRARSMNGMVAASFPLMPAGGGKTGGGKHANNIRRASWMQEPELR